jgi:hypothetical protein
MQKHVPQFMQDGDSRSGGVGLGQNAAKILDPRWRDAILHRKIQKVWVDAPQEPKPPSIAIDKVVEGACP